MADKPRQAPPGAGYAANRPYFVADSLDDLHGPTSGVVHLDPRLDWSGEPVYDLDDLTELAYVYEVVLREGSRHEEFARWLDRPTLIRLWPTLFLPARVRVLWERKFPVLAQIAPHRAAAG